MTQINPREIIKRGIVEYCSWTKVQQVGIDLSLISDVEIEHGQSKNVTLSELINLPNDIFATFHQRSTYSRMGVFVTTGIYDPGYHGTLGCTIYNMSGKTIKISEGQTIGQLICFKADPASSYNGQYQGK